ncbi:MAG: DUF1989 domain-containing protein [Oleiphilaceae bacterium]|nr:DUF1989 domain-containing protein [Oleiphilaceae bacterium]
MLKDSPRVLKDARFRQTFGAGDYFLKMVKAGETFRIIDVEGNEAADALFYNAHDTAERYSATDTVREQGNVYLEAGSTLMSNRQRPMLEIVADTVGRHDTLGGACASESNTVRYAHDRRCMHSCRDNWMNAISENGEFGLSKRDITHNINFFMNVPITPEGGLSFADGISGPGKYVEMTALMDVIVLISNCPQLNNPCSGFNPTPLEVAIWEA